MAPMGRTDRYANRAFMKINIDIPPENSNLKMSEFDFKMYLGVKLYEEGVMSSGLAARILGMERDDFILNMGKYGKSIFDKTDEEIKRDSEAAKQFIR